MTFFPYPMPMWSEQSRTTISVSKHSILFPVVSLKLLRQHSNKALPSLKLLLVDSHTNMYSPFICVMSQVLNTSAEHLSSVMVSFDLEPDLLSFFYTRQQTGRLWHQGLKIQQTHKK